MFFFDDNEIIRGLKKYPVLSHFSGFALRRLVSQSEILSIDAHQTLFNEGEPSDSVYYLIEGHLEGVKSDRTKTKVAAIRAGELVGEVDVVADEPRGMTVNATRNSRLIKINKQMFIKYFQSNPDLVSVLAQSMARRLRHKLMNDPDTSYEYKNIGLIALFPDLPMDDLKEVFRPQVAIDGFHLYDKAQFEASGQAPINFFHQCELNVGINLFFCVHSDDMWSKEVLNQVDYVYVLTWDQTWDNMPPDVLDGIRERPCDIAILHPVPAPYKNTSCFYDRFPFKRHHHLMNTKADFERFYRFMTGQAIGLVVGGGGLRGFAHYGFIKSLFESKIPIDYVGGSSMGALIAAMYAIDVCDWTHFDTMFHDNMEKVKKTIFLKNLTLPLVSLFSGKTLSHFNYEMFGSYQIEDLKTNYFCVVANLSDSKKEIITKGALWEWIRASTSIPGLAPPFEKDGSIYVDGGICSNLPVADMRIRLDDAGQIIAFNLQNPPFKGRSYKFPPILTMKAMLLYLLGFAKYRYVMPSIVDILTEAPLINQYFSDSEGAKTAEVMVHLNTTGSAMMSKDNDTLIPSAYEVAQNAFREKKALFTRWIPS